MAITKTDKAATFKKAVLKNAGENIDIRMGAFTDGVTECRTKEEYVQAIASLWSSAQEKFLTIGRYLLTAKEKLEHSEFERMIECELPFKKSVAYILRRVAQAVDNRMLERDECPRDYMTAYQLVSLPPPHFEIARQKSLVRPTTTRKEVLDFKRSLKETETITEDRKALARRQSSLITQIRKLQEELADVERKLEAGEHDVIDGVAVNVTNAEVGSSEIAMRTDNAVD